ncbi:MAG: hypothetical protein ACRCYZ_06975, partial [Alphaproteobacteria bacterium]
RLVSFSPKLYPYLDHGWALTVHQSQGVTVDRTFVLASPGFSRNLAYVALSRHREDVQVFGAFCEFKTHEKLMASLSKMSEKLGALDYVEPEAASALQEPPSGALEAALEKLWRQLDAIQFVTLEAWREVRRSFLERSTSSEIVSEIRTPLPELSEASRARTLLASKVRPSGDLSHTSLESLHLFLSKHLSLPTSLRNFSEPLPKFLQAFLKDRLEELVASESRGLSASATLSEVLDVRVEAHRRGVIEAVLYQHLLQTSPPSKPSNAQKATYLSPQDHPWFYEVIDRASELVALQKTQQENLEPFFRSWLASSSSDLQKLIPHATSFLEHVVTLHFYTGKLPRVEHLRETSTLVLASRLSHSKKEKMLQEEDISPQVEAAVHRYQTRLGVERVLEISQDKSPISSFISEVLPPQESRNFETILAQANNDLQRFQEAARQREQELGR